MKMKTLPGLSGLMVLSAFLVVSGLCFSPRAAALSVEEEKAMGEVFVNRIQSHFRLLEQDFANHYIQSLGHHLAEFVDTQYFPFRFYIINDDTLNAFAGPGGHIFIFTGLLNEMEDIDELAAVLAHEIAHVSARHISERIDQSKKIGLATLAGILAGALVGGEVSEALMTGTVAAGIQTQLHYSREDERQADQIGFDYMEAATFDPGGMMDVLYKLQKPGWSSGNEPPAYLRTHPTGPERMANLDSMLSGYRKPPCSECAEEFRTCFPFFKSAVRAKSKDPQHTLRQLRKALEKSPDSARLHFALGLVTMEISELSQAIRHLEAASTKRPDFVPILAHLGEAYQRKGDYEKALSVLQSALRKGEPPYLLYSLAQSYENLERYQDAIPVYEKLASSPHAKDEVYYHLGVCYGRQDRLARAHYNFGIYFRRRGEGEKAKFHFNKARDLSGKDQALRRKIEEASEPHDP